MYIYLSPFENEHLMKVEIIIESTESSFFSKNKKLWTCKILKPDNRTGYAALRAASPELNAVRHDLACNVMYDIACWRLGDSET